MKRNFLNEAFDIHLGKFEGVVQKEHVSAVVDAYFKINEKSERLACLMKKVFEEAVRKRLLNGLRGLPHGPRIPGKL